MLRNKKNHQNFANFLKTFFYFTVNFSQFQKSKNYIWTNAIFHAKAENDIVFSLTHPFMRGTVYHKNWQNHEMGQKKSIFEIDTENTPHDI